MHVDASPKGEHSNSRALSKYFVEKLRDRVPRLSIDYLDLALEPPAHPTAQFTRAIYTTPNERTPEMVAELAASDRLCHRVLTADAFVFAMPMHNFTVPSVFKAFIDNLVRAGLTYKFTSEGRQVGCLDQHRALFITTRGSDLRPGNPMAHMDALTPVLRAAFGFMGVMAPLFVDAQPLQFADFSSQQAALLRARSNLDDVARIWTKLAPHAGRD